MSRFAAFLVLVALTGCGSRAESDAARTEHGRPPEALAARPPSAQPEPEPVRLDNSEQFALASRNVRQTFQIKVGFPRGYDSGAAPYPVLYVTDAETNFGGITYIVQRLIKDRLIPPLLVVGIGYGTDYDTFYELRSRDLTPTELPNLRIGGKVSPTGGAAQFLRFLADELFPEIERRYRADPDDRALYGHSYGGLFGSYVLLTRPDLFRRYLVLSPSLWYDDGRMLRDAGAHVPAFAPTVVYMAAGELEPRIDDEVLAFADSVRAHAPANLRLRAVVFENETHRTVFGRGFTDGLRYIYGGVR
jgi:predicted alpha/beta superfamily hydrolase